MEYTRTAIVAELEKFVADREKKADEAFEAQNIVDQSKVAEWGTKFGPAWAEFAEILTEAMANNKPITRDLIPESFALKGHSSRELKWFSDGRVKRSQFTGYEETTARALIAELNTMTSDTLDEQDLAVLGIRPQLLFDEGRPYPLTDRVNVGYQINAARGTFR